MGIWAQVSLGRSVIYFIDNESARMGLRMALISCSTPNGHAVWRALKFDAKAKSRKWYATVPSFSNPADDVQRRVAFNGNQVERYTSASAAP
eukprot:697097-Amphidinium_carterae.1